MSFIKTKTLKKAISTLTMISTVVWLSGISMFAVSIDVASAAIADGALISSNATNSDGTPTLASLDVYIVKLVGAKQFKRLILNPTVFSSYGHLNWNDVQEVSQAVMDSYTTSSLVRVDTDAAEKVFAMAPDGDIGSKSWVNLTTAEATSVTGYDADSVYTINSTDGGNYNTVDDIATTSQLATFYSTGALPGVTPVPAGEISVSLSASTPASATLVNGQAVAHLADFTFAGTGTVKSLTLKRIGVSADTTPVNVYLFDGASRITDSASFSTGSVLTFSATSLFAVNGTKTISVKADITDNTAGQTVGVTLNAVTLATGSATGLPISGNIHSIADATLATVAMGAATGSGDTDAGVGVLVWQGTATVGTRDVLLNRLALRQIGSIVSADINNFKLNIDGTEVATVANLDSNGYVTFAVSQAMKSGARVVKVYADVIGGAGRTVQMSLRGAYDVTSVDTQYNANVLATGTFPFGPSAFTVNSGTMTVVKKTDSQSSNVVVGATDQSLATYTFTAYGEAIKVETLKVGMITTGGTVTDNTLQNVRVLVDGGQVGSTTSVPAALSFAANAGTQFTTNFVVNPGTPATVEIRADIIDNEGTDNITAGTTTAVQAVLVGGTGSNNAVPQTSLGTINTPTDANVLGNNLTIASGSISIAKTSSYADQTTAVPATAYKIGSFQLSGNATEAVNINTMYVGFTASSTVTEATDLTNLYVVYGGTTSSVKGSVSSTILNGNNWSISKTLAKNATMQFDVYANLASSVSTNAIIATLAVAGITANSSTTVYADGTVNTSLDAGVAGQTITGGTGSITASLDASTAAAQIVDDSGTVKTLTAKIAAVTDSYTVTDMVVTVSNASAVSNVTLKNHDTNEIIGASKPGATSITWSGLVLPVVAGQTVKVDVELELTPVGVGAGTSGAALTTAITGFTARNSAGTSAAGTGSATGNAVYIYAAIPSITNAALPSTYLGTGTQTVSKFTVASSGGTVGWKKLIFTVTRAMSGTDTLATPTLWDANTNIVVAGAASFTGGVEADGGTSGTIVFVATDEQQISGSKTYVLKLVTAGTLVTGDNLSVSIAQPSNYAAPAAYASVAATAASFVWSDVSASSHDTTTSDWNNGYLVKNLPTDTQTLTK